MQASDLISQSLISLHPDDDGLRAISLMEELRVNHLPVVRNGFYLGILSEKEILNWDNEEEFIEELEKFSLTVIPVLDEEKHYLGSITNRKLLYTIAKSTSIQSNGGVIVLRMNQNDYQMSEIARIVEDNNTKILSSYITSIPDALQIELTLKLNTMDINSIVKDLERFDYNVSASFNTKETNDDFTDRYESLMRFLNP